MPKGRLCRQASGNRGWWLSCRCDRGSPNDPPRGRADVVPHLRPRAPGPRCGHRWASDPHTARCDNAHSRRPESCGGPLWQSYRDGASVSPSHASKPRLVERIQKSKGVHIEKDTSMRIFVLRMNNKKPPLDNLNARKCLAHAFNYDGFIKEILKGYAVRNPAPMPNNLWGYPKDAVGYDYDLKKAKAFCDKAKAEGAPIDRPIEIHIQSQLEQTNQAAQLLQSDLAEIGVNLKIISDTWANITTNTAKAETTPDMWVHWVSTYFVDPENWVGQMYDSQFQGTWKASAWYNNPKVDELLRKARVTVAQAERQPLYEEATRLIVADSPDIWVYNTVELRGVSDRVKDFRFSPVGSGGEMRWIQLI